MNANRCGKGKPFLVVSKLVSVITLIFFSAGTVFALPAGQQVVNGQVSFVTQGNNLTITNSPNSIINWQGFSINNNEAVRFIQQYGSSAVLNRVIGQDPSRILGLLQSNGRVFLINPNGILFGQGARIDVNGFVASTLDISNQDFMAGKYNFTAGAIAGSIQNQGTITTPEGGKVYLIAPDIENSGIINSPNGDVILAAGHSVYLVDSLDPDISVVISAPEDKAVNLGQILAQSGKVGIYGGLVSQKGIVNADSAVVGENGRIFFKATKDVTLDAGSITSAKGGTIEVLGGMEDGTVRVSGIIDASAPSGGDGGFIETSAANVKVDDSARITTLALYGKTGTWLIDPVDFTIATSGGNITGTVLGTLLGSNSVTIHTETGTDTNSDRYGTTGTNGDIFVNDSVSWTANRLTLNAYRNININSTLNGSGIAQLALEYGQGAVNAGNTATYSVNAPVNLPAGLNFSTKLGNDGTPVNFTVINSLIDLQGMNGLLSGTYALGTNIDASATIGWNGGAGFMPVGNIAPPFTGVFDGLGHTITGLYINRPTADYIGLFGNIGSSSTISNFGLVNGNITGQNYVGELAGLTFGAIGNSFSTGAVTGTGNFVGGLVGVNNGNISNSYSSGAVTGIDLVGGLVGFSNGGSIGNSYNTAAVTGTGSNIGGLVGVNAGSTITNSYWDTQSSGLIASSGGTGLTTAQMMTQASYSGWGFPGSWNIVGGISYPYLAWQFIGTPQIISGTLAVAGAGRTIQTAVNGAPLAATSTGANGFFYFALPGNSVPSGSAFLSYVSGDTVKGAYAYLSGGTHITNLSLNSNTLIAGGGTMSNTTFGIAQGTLPSVDILYTVSGSNLTLNDGFNFLTRVGTVYSLDGNITTMNGSQAYNGPVTLVSDAVLTNNGTGGNISFGGAVTGAVRNLTLNTVGTVSQTAPITVEGLELLGAGAIYTLTNAGNAITTLAGNTGTVNFTNSKGLGIGTVNTAGLTTSGDFTLSTIGAITTDTAPVSSSGGAVSITAHSPLTIGSGGVSSSNNVSLVASPSGGSDDLTINGTILSSNGNIILSAGSSIILGPGGSLSAPNGTVTQTEGLNGVSTPTAILAVIGNEIATDNTLSSTIPAIEIITSDETAANENQLGMTDTGTADTETADTETIASDESSDDENDENEVEEKTVEGGGQTTDDKKTDIVKTYCN